jgi:putative DNA methylase
MTRMIERWFPCAEVSINSGSGWGSGNAEIGLFPWFAKRPTAQAKAAIICSLLRWPDDPAEQQRLQNLVRASMTGRYEEWAKLRKELDVDQDGPSILDPFSGRGIIPNEGARLGLRAHAIDYSPVAVLASRLLTDFPFRDWSDEPELPFGEPSDKLYQSSRLLHDVEAVLNEVGRRWSNSMEEFYPAVNGKTPWGYLWAITIPCQECGIRFPLVGSYQLRPQSIRKGRKPAPNYVDQGQSFFISFDEQSKTCTAVTHDGPPKRTPTLTKAIGRDGRPIAGKSAICPACAHVHPLELHRRLTNEGHARDMLLVVADHGESGGKHYRQPVSEEFDAVRRAEKQLASLPKLTPFLPAIPNERIAPGNNNIIGPSIYGARTYGDFMCDRQTLAFTSLAGTIDATTQELRRDVGISEEYCRALAGYAASVLARKIRRSTRGCTLDISRAGVHDIYANQGSITFSQDFFEAGIGTGAGTWNSLSGSSIATLRGLLHDIRGASVSVLRGSATALPYKDRSIAAVVTDPPYDEMIAYADSSDLIYVWVKRALHTLWPELLMTADEHGGQEKAEEIIVKRVRGEAPNEHRTRAHYDAKIAQAFAEMRRVVKEDGVVTIVFGSGDPEVWQRLLAAIQQADLVMTGSWPATTEASNHQGKANIETTLTMACRPAPTGRRPGRKGTVEAEIKTEIHRRYPDWARWGLAPADVIMAAAGPAMEIVGRYSEVLDARGDAVGIHTFLPLARAAVQAAMAVEVDNHPLEAFDARTRFALWWVRLYGRQPQAKSELRWQALASSMDLADVRDLVPDTGKSVRFTEAKDFTVRVNRDSAVIDVALALASASDEGTARMGEVLAASQRSADDSYLWAAVKFLADRLPTSDSDAIAFTRVARARNGITTAADTVVAEAVVTARAQKIDQDQLRLL